MQLFVLYTVGDGYTYTSDVVRPVVSTTKETFLKDFEANARQAVKARCDSFKVGGHSYCVSDFIDISSTKTHSVDTKVGICMASITVLTFDELLNHDLKNYTE